MQQQYSIFKDELPEKTIKKIKDILYSVDLEVLENYFYDDKSSSSPVSLRVYNKNFDIGTNGKGTSVVNARASAYAEFMERLQNSMLINFYPSVSSLKKAELSQKSLFNSYNEHLKNFFQEKCDVLSTYKLFDMEDCIFQDFYSVKDKKIYNLPYSIIRKLDGSNGMSSGNTVEEAIVQACSEICERYVIKEVIKKRILMPNIDISAFSQYTNINNIIEYYKSYGLDVILKDASLNGSMPCVCAVILNKAKKFLHLSFGSHPSFPVAIERTLTEFAQGKKISEYVEDPSSSPIFSVEKLEQATPEQLLLSMFHRGLSFELSDNLKEQYLSNEFDYSYSKSAFINETSIVSNKMLMNFIIKKLLKFSDDILIRDNSFLGFPAVKVFIPQISEMFSLNENSVKDLVNCKNWGEKYDFYNNKDIYNINSLYELAKYGIFVSEEQQNALEDIFCVTYEYIALLCSVVLKDSDNYLKILKLVRGQNKFEDMYTDQQLKIFEIIEFYFLEWNKNKNVTEAEIKELLSSKYMIEEIDVAFNIIKNLTYESILNIVLREETEPKEKNNTGMINKLAKLYTENNLSQSFLVGIFE